jgi:hypothetical protein
MTAVPVKVAPRCALAEDAIIPIVSTIIINRFLFMSFVPEIIVPP